MQEAVVTPSIHAVSRDGARFMVIFITMIYAAEKIRKENIIEALRDDMA